MQRFAPNKAKTSLICMNKKIKNDVFLSILEFPVFFYPRPQKNRKTEKRKSGWKDCWRFPLQLLYAKQKAYFTKLWTVYFIVCFKKKQIIVYLRTLSQSFREIFKKYTWNLWFFPKIILVSLILSVETQLTAPSFPTKFSRNKERQLAQLKFPY